MAKSSSKGKAKGSRASSSTGSTAGSSSSSSSVLNHLKMLREFCPDWSETDLSNCLRQASYNVELAAERLMTGQYKATATPTPKSEVSTAAAATTTTTTPSAPATKKRPSPTANSSTAPRPQKKQSPDVVTPATAHRTTTTNSRAAAAATATPNISVVPKATPSASQNRTNGPLPPTALLLCEQWVVAICMSRVGRISFREPLELSHYHTGNNTSVRFRGQSMEGNLPKSLSAMLTPLLRYSHTHDQPTKLIELRAEALMEDKVPMGGEVPLKLTVYITAPEAFFALLDQDPQQQSAKQSASAMFFSNRFQKKSSNKRGKLTLSEAAFAFLQWAEYGKLPEIPEFEAAAAAAAKSTGLADNQDNDNPEDDDASSSSDTEEAILSEDEFLPEDSEENNSRPEWTNQLINHEGFNANATASLPEMGDPEGFQDSVVLRPYQRQALHWMMMRENNGESQEELEKELTLLSELASSQHHQTPSSDGGKVQQKDIVCDVGPVQVSDSAKKAAKTFDGQISPLKHPLWQERFLANRDMDRVTLFYVNELLGTASLRTPEPPKHCSGGILADDMGLGKTIACLALILKSKEEKAKTGEKPGPTLVVAPLSLISQWKEEIETKTNLTYRMHYGDQAKSNSMVNFQEDVVITTYGTLQAELKQARQKQGAAGTKIRNGILGRTFERAILDEAHNVKNQATLASKACCQIVAKFRWALSGTVIHNSVDDVFALLKFLKHQPWCEPAFWKSAITAEMHRKEDGEPKDEDGEPDPTGMMVALGRVRRLLSPIMLRRTKDSLNKDGTPILTLPPVETTIVNVTLSPAEREFYDALNLKSQSIFDGYIEAGTASKSWFAIFSLLARLRMACDHIALTVRAHIDQDDWNIATRNGPGGEATDTTPKAAAAASSSNKDGLDDSFLNGLLKKFREKTGKAKDSKDSNSQQGKYSEQVAQNLSQAVKHNETHISEECPICLENPLICDAVITNCAHIFCRDCLVDYLKANAGAQGSGKRTALSGMQCPNGHCPTCQSEIEASKIIALSKTADGNATSSFLTDVNKQVATTNNVKRQGSPIRSAKEKNARKVLENAVNGGAESSKLTAIIEELYSVWKDDPGTKIIIFSQFLGFLDLLETALRDEDIKFGRLDGKLSLQQRVSVLESFKENNVVHASGPRPLTAKQRIGSVLLVSMKAGGVGLNLTSSSTVFISDPWWNSSVEEQCIGRVRRIGQTAEVVRVRKFVVENSVEERIVELQQKKKDMASHVYCDVGSDAKMNDSRPSIDDFKLMFGRN